MAVNETNILPAFLPNMKTEIPMSHTYVETPSITSSSSMDALRQFQANLTTLEDLGGRLRFVMTEIRGLIRK